MNFEGFSTSNNQQDIEGGEKEMTKLEAHTFLGQNKELPISLDDLDNTLNTGNIPLNMLKDLREEFYKADENGEDDKVQQFHKMFSEVNDAVEKIKEARSSKDETEKTKAEKELVKIINDSYDSLIQ